MSSRNMALAWCLGSVRSSAANGGGEVMGSLDRVVALPKLDNSVDA